MVLRVEHGIFEVDSSSICSLVTHAYRHVMALCACCPC